MSGADFQTTRPGGPSPDRRAGNRRGGGGEGWDAMSVPSMRLPPSVESRPVKSADINKWLRSISQRRVPLGNDRWDGDPYESKDRSGIWVFTVQREALLRLARALINPEIPRFNIAQYIVAGRSAGIFAEIESRRIPKSDFTSACERVGRELQSADEMRLYPELPYRLYKVVQLLAEAGCPSEEDFRSCMLLNPDVSDAVEGVCRNFECQRAVGCSDPRDVSMEDRPTMILEQEMVDRARMERRKIVEDVLVYGFEDKILDIFASPGGTELFISLDRRLTYKGQGGR